MDVLSNTNLFTYLRTFPSATEVQGTQRKTQTTEFLVESRPTEHLCN